MPSIRAPVLRTALQPLARNLPRTTQPFITQVRHESARNTRDEKWYEPNDGGKTQTMAENKGPTAGRKLDGTGGAVNSSTSMLIIGAITAALAGVYFIGMSKSDTVIGTSLKNDPEAVKHKTGSDRQRKGGPERSEK